MSNDTIQQQLKRAFENKGNHYKARTRYLDKQQQPYYINRLILEDSPYLLQHAHNPVDWFPWGMEAFNKAKKEHKLVFLSIGYSTCHWCHVMEEESFDNEAIAKQLNETFICIKVDRELHIDVDAFYMTAVMIMQGHGGWPMSSFLTADRKPFFCGTYYPPAQFSSLLNRINQLWQQQPHTLLAQADTITQQVTKIIAAKSASHSIDNTLIDDAAKTIINQYDHKAGGFGSAPKFPHEPYLYFLISYATHTGRSDIMNMVVHTLHQQSCGGIYDQLAGGFHRYATDNSWLVPHFEKMLYNQANLATLFTQAYRLTQAKDFRRVATETLDYVIREMTDCKGGFYTATDADSEGIEGLFFIWDKQEIATLLGNDAAAFIELYQVTEQGNFEGKNILNLGQPLAHHARENNKDYDELIQTLAKQKAILQQARQQRPHPLRDDKMLTAWNSMMINAFAYAGQQLQRKDYINAALCAANYLLATNQLENGQLSRMSLAGKAAIPARQEDYAYLALALLQLYDTTLDKTWLTKSITLSDEMIQQFWDEQYGGFFIATTDNILPIMPKEHDDNATASGNSVAFRVLVRLTKRTGIAHYQHYAEQLLKANAAAITRHPASACYLMDGVLEMHYGEQTNTSWAGAGNIHIHAELINNNQLLLTITPAKGWQLNPITNDDGKAQLVTITSNNGWQLKNIVYADVKPPAKTMQITADITSTKPQQHIFPANLIKLTVNLQACTQQYCLASETVHLLLTTPLH